MRNGQYLFIMSTKVSDVLLRGIIIQKKISIFIYARKGFRVPNHSVLLLRLQ